MTTNEAAERLHAVYPGGPSCNPNCPGEHSMYHDGYADGYENGENAERRATVERIRERMLDWDGRIPAGEYLHQVLDEEAARDTQPVTNRR